MAWSQKGKVTRRERFLAEMDAVIPWQRLIALIEPCYPKAGRGQHHDDADLQRLRGEILRASGADDAAAEDALRAGVAVAQEKGAPGLEVRAATSLAHFPAHTARAPEARTLLRDVLARFTEGFDVPDLKDARALLDTLA